MDRRAFLKLTGLIAAAPALRSVPIVTPPEMQGGLAELSSSPGARGLAAAMALPIREAGTYRISGVVRLEAPLVEISGLTHSQSISWSGYDAAEPALASFVSFEEFDGRGGGPEIRIEGGRLESLAAVPLY